jgi:transcription antitermination factor NusG
MSQDAFLPGPLDGQVSLPSQYAPSWFAVFTTPRHEKAIAQHCSQRQIEVFLPIYRESKQWKNRSRVTLELPLFPNYLFVRIERKERFRVLNVPGVISILGAGTDPLPVADGYIASLREGVLANKILPYSRMEVGDLVRIVNGAMTGMEGTLIRIKNEMRVVIRIALLDRCMAVEVTAADIEHVSSAGAHSGAGGA